MAGTIQSSINQIIGQAGAAIGIGKTLVQRQQEQERKVKEKLEAKKKQQQRLRKSPILDKYGQNMMVPIKKEEAGEKATKPAPKKVSVLLGADGRNITSGNK